MNIQDYAEYACEQEDKEIYHQTVERYNTLINEYVDYEVLVEIRLYTDGVKICEIQDELLNLYDDEGTMIEQFRVTLPSKYREEALERAKEYEQY